MPYAKNIQRLLAGSLNYRLRGTELPDNDAQKLDNWAFDQSGGLRSRKGHSVICTASGTVRQMIRALEERWQAVGNAYIVGFKKYVWKAGAGTAEKACTPIITTAGMRKSNGTTDWRWIPAAPTDPPVIESAETATQLLDNFQGGDWEVDPAGIDDLSERGLELRAGQLDAEDFPAVFSATKNYAADFYDGQDKDDYFKLTCTAKNWANINGVAIDIDVNSGDFVTDVYRAKANLKDIKAGKKEEVVFIFRKRKLETDVAAEDKFKYAEFERIGQTPEKDWRSVTKIRVKVEFNAATVFWFSKLELVGNEDNRLEGDDFGVYYTYTTADGHESNPSPKSKLITVNRGSIRVTEMVESDDPQVTGQNIYVTGGTLGAVYRANGAREAAEGAKPADPPTGDPLLDDPYGPIQGTEYVITASADDLTGYNIVMEDDHDDPPDADGLGNTPFFGRILAFKGRRVYWSHQNKPFAFTNPDGPDGDWVDADETIGVIKWISVRPDQAWVYGTNDMYVAIGDLADAQYFHPSGLRMGTPSRAGVAMAGPSDVAYLGSGIYLVDASGAPRKLSARIEPIFQGRTVTLWDGTVVQPISDPSTVAVGYEDGIVRLSHSEGSLWYSIALDRWVGDTRKFTCFQAEGEAGVLGALDDGTVVHIDDTFADGGDPIQLDFLSKAYDCGIQDNEKRFEDVTLYHDTNGQDLTLTVYYAEGLGVSTTLNSSGRSRTVFKLNDADGIRARNLAIGITGDVTDEVFIDSIDLNYYPEAREARSYDTAVSDAGSPKVKLIRELQVDLENDNAVEVRLEADVFPLALSERESHTVGTNLFRRTQPVVMTSEVYAHGFRIVASGAGHFRMFGARALVQIIGTFLHGEQDEYYLSDPLDFGSERVKLVREIEIVYRSVSTAAVTLYSDLPGNVMTSRATFVLPATNGEQNAKLRLVGTIRGRLYQLRIDPVADWRCEAIRFRVKFIGEPAATAWQWIDLPMEKTQDAIWQPLSFGQDQVA